MKFLRNLSNAIYSGYSIVLFVIIMIILIVFCALIFPLGDRRRTLAAHSANRAMLGIWLALTGCKIDLQGADKIDPDKTYMFVANHNNTLDMIVIGHFLQHYYKVLAKKELKYVPLFGILIQVIGLMVDRSSAESRKRSTEIMVDKMRHGMSFLIFAEGTRNKTDQPLKSFYPGAFRTAIMAEAPVLPFVLVNHRRLQPVGTMRLHPGTIGVRVLDAVETTGMTVEQTDELQARVHKAMEDVILLEDDMFKGSGSRV